MKIRDYTYQHPWLAKIIGFIVLFPTIFGSLWAFFDPLDPFGLKFLKDFGIWGYIVLLIVAFLISIIVVIFFIEKPRKTLPKIETELQKKECKKKKLSPEFFRRAGPYWVDFEEGNIYRRNEVGEIINKLKKEPQQAVIGEPASGKSVLLKYIGFDLKNSGYKVFYVDCKHELQENIGTYLKEAVEIDSAMTLIIVDNYHRQIDNCEYFLKQYRNQGMRKTKVLIGSRPITNRSIETSLFNELDSIELEAIDLVEELIALFLNKVHNVTGETRVAKASRELERFKHNLWHLSYALKAYDISAESVSVEDIHLHINNWITAIGVGEDKPINAGDVFLPLCTFYRFEFPVEKKFLTKILGIEDAWINELVSLSEITEIEETGRRGKLALPHSSLASLYFETYQSTDFPDLGDNVKDTILDQLNTDDWEEGLFQLYLTSAFTNRLELISHLAEYWDLGEYRGDYWEDSKRLEAIFRKLIKNETVETLIKGDIERADEQDFEDKTYGLLTSIANFLDLELSLELATTCVVPKLNNKSLSYVVSYVGDLIEHTHAKLFIPFVEIILSKLETCTDIETVGKLISKMTDPTDIPDRDDLVEVGFEIVPKVVDSITARIEKENDLRKIEIFLDQTEEHIGLGTAESVASRINVESLTSKIEQEYNLEKIKSCVETIAGLNKDVAVVQERYNNKNK